MAEQWYSIKEIKFWKPHMRFLIDHLAELKDGNWPERPGDYVREVKMACKAAKEREYKGLCVNCPFKPCLMPGERTPNRIRKERSINKVLEIAAEVDSRIDKVIDYISGWKRPEKRISKNGHKEE